MKFDAGFIALATSYVAHELVGLHWPHPSRRAVPLSLLSHLSGTTLIDLQIWTTSDPITDMSLRSLDS